MRRTPLFALGAVCIAAMLSACGGSKSAPPTTAAAAPPPPSPPTNTTKSGGAAALKAEAVSAATGDIPDNQVFLTFRNRSAGYSVNYPEGWAQSGSGGTVTFRDKNNIVRVVVTSGPQPTIEDVKRQIAALGNAKVTTPPSSMTASGKPAVHVVYETQSAPSAVTGKRVTLGVDRYYLWNGKRVAVVDLGTPLAPVKVDNVDAYRLIIQSFRWL